MVIPREVFGTTSTQEGMDPDGQLHQAGIWTVHSWHRWRWGEKFYGRVKGYCKQSDVQQNDLFLFICKVIVDQAVKVAFVIWKVYEQVGVVLATLYSAPAASDKMIL